MQREGLVGGAQVDDGGRRVLTGDDLQVGLGRQRPRRRQRRADVVAAVLLPHPVNRQRSFLQRTDIVHCKKRFAVFL